MGLPPGPRMGAPAPCRVVNSDDDTSDEDIPILEIEDAIDLHGFRPRDVPSVVESYLEAASAKGFTEVRLIHGRGKGVQRARVQQLLRTSPYVAAFADAPPTRGGWGATVVWLRGEASTPPPET